MSYILFDLQKIFNLIEYDATVSINGDKCVPVFDGCKYSERTWNVEPIEVKPLEYVYQLAAQRGLGLPDVPIERDAEFLMNVICVTYKYFMDDFSIDKLRNKTVETYTCILLALGTIKYVIGTLDINTWEQLWLEKMGNGDLVMFVRPTKKEDNNDNKKEGSDDILKVIIEDEYTENIIREYMNTFGRTCAINAENIGLVTECHNLALEKCIEFNIDVGQNKEESVNITDDDYYDEDYDEDYCLPEDVNNLEDVD